jgi:4-amino-4-deoxy-L-arabinose transferase-like glycosyltransferase
VPNQPAPAAPAAPRLPIAGVELALVFMVALAVLLPGVWNYSLVDPWETHYAEVGRRMLQDDDLVQTKWSAEGFRSKPVLTFWLMAGSMKALGIGDGGGYSGEMVSSPMVMLALRLPFVLFGVLGLVAAWWMVARLIGRRAAWLGLLVLGTTPFYLLVARQAITDMTLVGCMVGAIAMFAVAAECGDERPSPLAAFGRRRRIILDQRHLLALVAGGFLVWQLVYLTSYFLADPRVGPGVKLPVHPALVVAAPLVVGLGLLVALELPQRAVRAAAYWTSAVLLVLPFGIARTLARRDGVGAGDIPRTTTARQVYLGWFWVFLGISVLGKGLPALGVVGVVCGFYVLLLRRWRALLEDRFELVRGFLLTMLIAAPWHLAMWLRDGKRFVTEYFIRHLWDRAAKGVHGERGTFEFLVSQVGYGMFVWAALVPAAMAALAYRARPGTADGRARLVIAVWGIASVAFFSLVQTKFHHYILPAVPALALAVGLWLDDVLAGRARGVGVAALVGAGLVLTLANDMMTEQKQWIEMFVYRYDRPWPSAPPYQVDLSDGFLALGAAAAVALGVMALPRLGRVGVAALGAVGLVTAMWAMHVYMPLAGTHWGMRDAMREYYDRRTVYGMRLVYNGGRQLADDWAAGGDVRDRWTIRTHVPEGLQEGQPMTMRITVRSDDGQRAERELSVTGRAVEVDAAGARVEVAFTPAQLAPLQPLVTAGRGLRRSARPPVRVVDADRLLAWQLYWRGENFWSGDEIWGPLPELKTSFNQWVNKDGKLDKFLADPSLAPPGRRYWVITDGGGATGVRSQLPTEHARDSLRVENTVSNKFSLASFEL